MRPNAEAVDGVHFAPDEEVGDELSEKGSNRGAGDSPDWYQEEVKEDISDSGNHHEPDKTFLRVKGEDGITDQGGGVDD